MNVQLQEQSTIVLLRILAEYNLAIWFECRSTGSIPELVEPQWLARGNQLFFGLLPYTQYRHADIRPNIKGQALLIAVRQIKHQDPTGHRPPALEHRPNRCHQLRYLPD